MMEKFWDMVAWWAFYVSRWAENRRYYCWAKKNRVFIDNIAKKGVKDSTNPALPKKSIQ